MSETKTFTTGERKLMTDERLAEIEWILERGESINDAAVLDLVAEIRELHRLLEQL